MEEVSSQIQDQAQSSEIVDNKISESQSSQGPTSAGATLQGGKGFGRLAFDALAPLLTLGAIIVYAQLSYSYNRFYGLLGVDPQDVGITYIRVLTGSVGFVLASLLGLILLVGGIVVLFSLLLLPFLRLWPLRRVPRQLRRRILGLLSIIVGIGLLVLWNPIPGDAQHAAEVVRLGNAVLPFHGVFNAVTLPIHAEPALVNTVGKKGNNPFVDSLKGHKLFYMGGADGIIVLYDSSEHRVIHLPASTIILSTYNCKADSPNALCENFYE